jgi:hypothetical protein
MSMKRFLENCFVTVAGDVAARFQKWNIQDQVKMGAHYEAMLLLR